MIYKTNPMFWEMNEKTGLRHLTLEHDGRVLFVVAANLHTNGWKASTLPMGYKMTYEEVLEFSSTFEVLPELMKFLERPDITLADVQEYISNL